MKNFMRAVPKKWAAILTMALVLPAFLACATGVLLKWRQVDTASVLAGEAAGKKYNTLRFQSYGPYSQQIIGYVLFQDGTEIVWDTAPVSRLGKMSLREAVDDYHKTVKVNRWSRASEPIVREVVKNGQVIAYTASDIMLDVNLWEDPEAGKKEGKTVIQLVYKDRRKLEGGGEGERSGERGR